jgi:hypothetical protein
MSNKIEPIDYKFVPVEPDPNFSAEKNKKVIEESIAKFKQMTKRKKKEWEEGARERTSAVARYIKALDNGDTEKNVLEYFGRKEIARLRGEEIRTSILTKLGDATKQKAQEQAKVWTTRP